MVNIISWNVNGIRSRIFNDKVSAQLPKNKSYSPENNSSLWKIIQEYDPDILCLQETRCNESNGKLATIDNYYSYFNYSQLTDARSANRYSGTAIYTKNEPNKIEYSVPDYDDKEGRIIIMYFNDFILINIYAPNSGTNYENKILFQNCLLEFIKISTQAIIFCGDFNIAVDTHFNKLTTPPRPGTYSHELEFYDKLIKIGLIDSKTDDDNIIYTWWDPRGKKVFDANTKKYMKSIRLANKGWRLDYIFTRGFITNTYKVLKHIGEDVIPNSSDHAPIYANINLK